MFAIDHDCTIAGRFIGVLDKSKFGRHPVLVYKIPDQESCYTFALHRTFQRSKTYRCLGCMKLGLYTAVKVNSCYIRSYKIYLSLYQTTSDRPAVKRLVGGFAPTLITQRIGHSSCSLLPYSLPCDSKESSLKYNI